MRLVLFELLLQHLALGVPFLLAASVLVERAAQPDDLVGEQPGAGVAHDGGDGRGLAGHLGLAAERLQLASDLAGEVGQPREVGLHGVELAEGLLLASSVLQDAGGLLDEAAAVLGARVQHGVELPLADDHVHLAPEAGVAQELLHVEQAARLAVDGVLARAVAEQRARDRDLAVLDRQRAVGVVDREADLRAAERAARGGAGEDDVLHLAAAQRLRALLPHDPGERVDDVGLARAVGADDARHARFEGEGRRLREGLESLQRQALEVHVPPFRLASALPTSVVEERRTAVRPRRRCCDRPLPTCGARALFWAAARRRREERRMPIEIRRLAVPERLGTPEAADFEAYAALGFELERANWGHDHFAETAAELLGRHRNDRPPRVTLCSARGTATTMVGRCGLGWERDERAATVEFTLGVLPSQRRRGVGSQLLAAAEEAARELGRSTIVAYSDHPDETDATDAPGADGAARLGGGAVLRAPDGDAELSAATPAAAFAARARVRARAAGAGEQHHRRRAQPTSSGATSRRARARAAADGYRLELWTDRTPERLVDAYAAARARMVLDVPAGGVTIDEERWDAARVREHESEELDGGTSVLVAAAVTDDGDVAGYTELELPPDRAFAYQYDTLVVGRAPGPRARHAREAREPRAARRGGTRTHASSTRGTPTRTSTCWRSTSRSASGDAGSRRSGSASSTRRRLRPTRADAASGAAGSAGSGATSGS